ncbi:malate dehydrogenase [Halobellus sp. EA9]|uniref:malate dehydrogenase n=1 Tax=Halobellus sp. EA9 TaxID=3421647 RepID=UPI003EBE30E9
MHATIIGGAGAVGVTVAYTLATTVPDIEIHLVDITEEEVAGHATDIEHAMNHEAHAVGQAIASDVQSGSPPVRTSPPAPDVVEDTDCIIVVYNVDRPEEAVGRGGREAYYQQNRPIADELGGWMQERSPCPVVVVTNPMDRITYRLWDVSEWPRESFVGYSLSETARAAAEIGRLRDVSPKQVYCPMMGEHGENVVPVFSKTTIDGQTVEFSQKERQQVLDYVREVPYEVMRQRGADKSSRWVSGRGTAALAHAILDGGTDEPVCASVPLDGEYGYADVCLSVPVTLSSSGWDEIISWDLTEWERDRLNSAYRHLQKQ